MRLDQDLTPYIRIHSNWIKDLKIRPEAVKLLEKKTNRKAFMTLGLATTSCR